MTTNYDVVSITQKCYINIYRDIAFTDVETSSSKMKVSAGYFGGGMGGRRPMRVRFSLL